MPVGTGSSTTTSPDVGAEPALRTVTVYVAPCCPTKKLPSCDLVIASRGAPCTMKLSGGESEGVVSPPPETVAMLLPDCAVSAMVITIVMGGAVAPGPSASCRLQSRCSPWITQAQPGPLADVGVSPAGSVSPTLIVPDVATGP